MSSANVHVRETGMSPAGGYIRETGMSPAVTCVGEPT